MPCLGTTLNLTFNLTDAIKTNLNTRKIQMQVTAVARPATN